MSGEEQHLTAGINSDGENDRDSEDEEFDPPAHRADRGAESLFEIHQNHDRSKKKKSVQDPTCRREAKPGDG